MEQSEDMQAFDSYRQTRTKVFRVANLWFTAAEFRSVVPLPIRDQYRRATHDVLPSGAPVD
jgi:hypothetical protein